MIHLEEINKIPKELAYFEKHGFIIRDNLNNPGSSLDSHWHDYYEFELLLEGSYNYHFNNTSYVITPGDAFLLSVNDVHSFQCLKFARIKNIRFKEDFLPKEITDFISSNNIFHAFFNNDELEYIKSRIDNVKNLDEDSLFFTQTMKNLISDIIIMFIRNRITAESQTISTSVQLATTYILQNFRKDISLTSVAKELSLTPNYLGNIIKKSTQKTFHQYLNNLRQKHACTLLVSTDASIKEIAFASGYNSVEHFLLTFKKHHNITPAQYRKLNASVGRSDSATDFDSITK